MQAAVKIPQLISNQLQQTATNDKVLDHFYDTARILAKMAYYPYALCSFYQNGQYYLKPLWDSSLNHFVIDKQEIAQFENTCCFNMQSDVLKPLAAWLQSTFKLNIQSASCLTCDIKQLSQQLVIILFSEQEHVVSQTTWDCMQSYLQQQQYCANYIVQNIVLQQKIDELENLNASRAKYFSVVAHDLRAPFHGILGCADILVHEKDILDEAALGRLVDYIADTAQSTYGLLENLLNWTMAEGGRFHVNPSHFQAIQMVQFVLDLLSASAYKKQVAFKVDVPDDLYLYADKNMVTSIVQNLCSNALKFSPANCQQEIKISAIKNRQWVEICIQDQGVGMTQEQLNQLFVEQAIPSTQGTAGEKGTGLGLVLCKRFIEYNNGKISVESKKNKGTQFIIQLPLGQK